MLCRTVLSAKTRLSWVNGAGGMLPGSVNCGAAAQVPTQWPPRTGVSPRASAAADTLTTAGCAGRTTALVIPAATRAVRITADRRPAVVSLRTEDLAWDRGRKRAIIDLIDLSNLGELWAYLRLTDMLSGGPR